MRFDFRHNLQAAAVVREFREGDDFDQIDRLVRDEYRKRHERIGVRFQGKYSVDNKRIIHKSEFFPTQQDQNVRRKPSSKGFVLESDGEIAAVMIVTLQQKGGNEEIRRFVRCVLASMEQLQLRYAGNRMSSRNLLSMIALCSEGFLLAPMGQVALYRHV